ncbi:MAG TPA: DUF6279 family lipoprotein [Burkholderiales bacterium]|nr:DUF6279 family lipoprotein [Burkholderiales bacterium]
MTRLITMLLFAALLAGCSMVRIGYPQLDTIVAWVADDYFDLDSQQKRDLRTRFARFQEWHRYEQLPEYSAFLSEAKARIDRGFTREDALWLGDGIRVRYRAIVEFGAEDMAALLMTITPQQLEHLQAHWEGVNRRFARQYRVEASGDEQRRAAGRQVLSRIRDWVGHLDDAQEQQILAWAAELPLVHGPRQQDRIRRQREFLQLMAQRDDPARFAARLRHFLLEWEDGRDPEYDRLFREWRVRQADLYAAVFRILLPHQRAAVADRLQAYINDFTQLARRPEAQAAAAR